MSGGWLAELLRSEGLAAGRCEGQDLIEASRTTFVSAAPPSRDTAETLQPAPLLVSRLSRLSRLENAKVEEESRRARASKTGAGGAGGQEKPSRDAHHLAIERLSEAAEMAEQPLALVLAEHAAIETTDREVMAMPTEMVGAYVLALSWRRQRMNGSVPWEWLEVAECRGCGPVPHVTGGAVVNCPWCWNRIEGRPRPVVGPSVASVCAGG